MGMKKIIAGLLIVLFSTFILASPALAFDPFEEVCRDNPSNSVCSTPTTDPITGDQSIVPKIANIIAAVGGVIAVVMIMVNGLTLITSNGDSAKLSKARESVIYAAIGIVVIVLARTIIAAIMRFI